MECGGCHRIIEGTGDLRLLYGCRDCFITIRDIHPPALVRRWLNLPNATDQELGELFENKEELQFAQLYCALSKQLALAYLLKDTVLIAASFANICADHNQDGGVYYN